MNVIKFQPQSMLNRLMSNRQGVQTVNQGMMVRPGSGLVNTTQNYPGEAMGLSVDEWRATNRNGWKSRGYILPLDANTNNEFLINISGQAREFFGISWHAITSYNNDATMPRTVNFMVNQELVIEEQPWVLLDQKYLTGLPFLPFRRLLSGSDNVKLSILNGATVQDVAVNFYYLGL